MVVEHTFVTTLEAPQTMGAAATLLQTFGFTAEAESGFQVGSGAWDALEVRRGKKRARRYGVLRDWPQRVRLEWDRGRVSVAMSITPPPRGRLDSNAAKLSKKETAKAERLLLAVVTSLENLLAGMLPQPAAEAQWIELERELEEQARRARRKNRIILIVAITLLVLAVGLLVVGIVSSGR